MSVEERARCRSERAAVIENLARLLEVEDRRSTLINYWFEQMGGGWVRPDWQRIATIAYGELVENAATPAGPNEEKSS